MKKRTPGLFATSLLLVSCAAAPPDPPRDKPPATTTGSAATATSPSLEPPKLRLPGDVAPVRYEVEMSLDPAKDSFAGITSIQIEARRPARVVWLHAQEIAIRSASFATDGGPVDVKVVPAEPFVGFVLPAELPAGKTGTLRIDYEAKIDGDRPQGTYSVAEGPGPDDRYVYSLFEPLDARRAFPCFDEPTYKVPWKLSIRVRKGHSAFTNSEVSSETDEGATRKITFAETPPLPSYLVAFMAGPFETVDAGTVGREKKRLRFIVPKGRGPETAYAAKVTPSIIQALEDYFGMPYPYSKLDVAVVPRYDGTMEHPGIVALGQPLSLIKPGEESLSRKQEYVDIAAHELAHYWFGDYVTMKWWDDTWLNESFAQWMDAKITDGVEPTWKFGKVRLDRAFSAMDADRLATAKKMRQPVESPEDILNAFDGALTYEKGATVIGMMEHAVTPATWQSVIRQYMAKHAWKNAASADFAAVLRDVAGPDAAASFETFLNQPGVPLVTVTPVCGGPSPKLRIEQRRFLPLGTTAQEGLWNVPVCIRHGAGAETGRTCVFTGEKTKEVPLEGVKACPEWVVPNEAGAGYYISSYSKASVDQIAGKRGPVLTAEERSTFLRDVGFLASSGAFPLGAALGLVPDAVAKGDRTTFQSVQAILDNVHATELTEPLHEKYVRFVRKAFGPRAKALGLAPKAGEDPDTVQIRTMLLYIAGVGAREPELLRTGKALAMKWLDDPKALSPDVVGPALALAAASNDKAYFDKALARAKAATDRTEKVRLLSSLGHVTDEALVARALALIISPDFDQRESLSVLFPLLFGRETRDLAHAFLEQHFDEILKKSTGFERPSLFMMAGAYCDEPHRKSAESFFAPRAKTVDGADRVLKNALESISLCEASRRAAMPDLEAFLRKQ